MPQFLPGGRHFLYWAPSGREPHGVYVGQLDGSETRWLLDADFPAVYGPPDRLLFVRQGALFAQRFDRTRLALAGRQPNRLGWIVLERHLELAVGEPAFLHLGRERAHASCTRVFLRRLVLRPELGQKQCSGPTPRISSVRSPSSVFL